MSTITVMNEKREARRARRDAYVCFCRAVTVCAVRAAVADGQCDLAKLAAGCGAGSACGRCRPALNTLLEVQAA